MEDRQNSRKCITHYAFLYAIFIAGTIFLLGCKSTEITSPPRSATEQLLLSTAVDQALAHANLGMFSGRSVYFDFTYFDGYDSKYAEGQIRDAFSRAGALVAKDNKSADVIVEARAGALSTDTNASFIGIPAIPLPIPGTAETPVTPQVSFYQQQAQLSYAKIALLAYDNKTRAHIYSSGPLDGMSYHTYTAIFFISWWATDIPERAKPKVRQQYEIWYPQYDLKNMPSPPSGK